jgi:hypothetical protein
MRFPAAFWVARPAHGIPARFLASILDTGRAVDYT